MKKFHITLIAFIFVSIVKGYCQHENDSKVILITLDGFRWQELFTGADETLVSNEKYVAQPEHLNKLFWRSSAKERRETLLPFIWNSVSQFGQIHGNRRLNSKMNLTNTHWFSYPGYNEILSGIADDDRINSNDKIPNPNTTVLETVNNTSEYNGHVAAFGSWDVFPYIVNSERSKIPVNAGFDVASGLYLTPNELYLNRIQKNTYCPWSSVRLDVFTHLYALEYMKKEHPNLVYIAFGETDDFAHDGNYEAYLKSAHRTDSFIKELWDFTQNDPFYKDNTTFIITTDHGRGTEPLDTWRSHGRDIKGADEVWLIVFGKHIESLGEVSKSEQIYTNQIAASIAKLLNVQVSKQAQGSAFYFINNP
ncbi:alkaline phosphatase family protein [Aestuariivivens sediminis]|uniref:alkaline phosphatase family protein n=1 Tax=Aestuariivivens sediminis TaxID=2913557 RepID=UPI001F563628|nr:alkaline phosphatase family protein [Aestuariivivens sediminis]